MSFDEQLHRAFDTLADRFRDALSTELRRTAGDVLTMAQADRDLAVLEEGSRVKAEARRQSAEQRVLDAIRVMDSARSLSQILDTLVSSVARDAPRVALLTLRHGELRTWRFVGFGPAWDQAGSTTLPSQEWGALTDVMRTGNAVASTPGGTLTAPKFALPDGQAFVAVPLVIGGTVAAVLYADRRAPRHDDTDRAVAPNWMIITELLARYAARCLESLTALTTVRAIGGSSLASSRSRPRPAAVPTQLSNVR